MLLRISLLHLTTNIPLDVKLISQRIVVVVDVVVCAVVHVATHHVSAPAFYDRANHLMFFAFLGARPIITT